MPSASTWSRRSFLAAVGAGACAQAVSAAETPAPGAMKWIVGYPAGGGADFVTRVLATQLGSQMKQDIEVVNMPGKGGTVAAGAAARATADGRNLFTADNGILVYNASLFKTLPYDPDKDFALIGFMARTPLVLVVSPKSGFTNFEQILKASKAGRTPPLQYASPGEGSPHHLAMELLKSQTGLVATHVPYRGTGMALPDVVSGKVPMLVVDLAGGLAPIKSAAVLPVLSMSGRRVTQLPDMPSVPYTVTGPLNAYATVGLVAPAGTPMPMQERLNAELQSAMRVPEVSRKLNDAGWETAAADATLLRAYMAAERAIWPALIRDRNITVTQ